MYNKRAQGTGRETKAAVYLEEQGYEILERNYRCPAGELDLIAWIDKTLIAVEVKYRASLHCGDPAEAVTPQKQRRIIRSLRYYMAQRHMSVNTKCRFDVIAMTGSGEIRHIRDAFWT